MSRPDSTRPQFWPARHALTRIISAVFAFIAAASLAFVCSGCAHRHVQAAPPVSTPPQPAAPVAAPTKTKSPDSIPAPTTPTPKNPVPTTPPPELNPPPDNPRRPETAAPNPSPVRPAAPQISPQISSTDQSQLEQQANQLIARAEQNLHRSDGRQLNSTQQDMVDKIRSFLAQAQSAMATSDWSRAKNLSQKAYLISLELVKTL